MYCYRCGQELRAGWVKCYSCGAKIVNPEAAIQVRRLKVGMVERMRLWWSRNGPAGAVRQNKWRVKQRGATGAVHVPKLAQVPQGASLVALIDCETTGMAREDQLIALAILLAAHREGEILGVVDDFYGLQEPTVAISAEASSVNGLTIAELKGRALDRERAGAILERAERLIAHNAGFDRRYLYRHFPEVLERPWHCSAHHIRWKDEGYRNGRLSTLAGGEIEHHAYGDALTLLEVLNRRDGEDRTYLARLLDRGPMAPPSWRPGAILPPPAK